MERASQITRINTDGKNGFIGGRRQALKQIDYLTGQVQKFQIAKAMKILIKRNNAALSELSQSREVTICPEVVREVWLAG
jgi:hypothetical protein